MVKISATKKRRSSHDTEAVWKGSMKMFEDVFTDKVSPFFTSMMSPAFKVDISEDDKAIFIEADMPGMKKEDVTVSMEDDVLSISAEREHSEEEKKKGYHALSVPGEASAEALR